VAEYRATDRRRGLRRPRRPARTPGGPRPGIPVRAVTDEELRARIWYYPGPDATRRQHNNAASRRHLARRELARREQEITRG
jgi:hypothetical protein